MLQAKPISTLALAFVLAVLAGCGGGGSDNSKQKLLDGYRALLVKSGVSAQVAQCYSDKAGELSDAELNRVMEASKQSTLPPDVVRLNQRLSRECIPAGSQAVNPNASSAAIQKGRALMVHGMTQVLRAQGATETQINCMTQQINSLPDSELVALTNSPTQLRSKVHAMARNCGGH